MKVYIVYVAEDRQEALAGHRSALAGRGGCQDKFCDLCYDDTEEV